MDRGLWSLLGDAVRRLRGYERSIQDRSRDLLVDTAAIDDSALER